MVALLRCILAVGGAALAASFAVAAAYHNSPCGRFVWALREAVDGEGSPPVFLGMAAVIAYPHAWALAVVLTALWPRSRPDGIPLTAQLAVQVAGGGVIALLGVLLLVSGDRYVATGIQVAAAVVPAAIVGVMVGLARFAAPWRRLFAVTVVGFVPQLAVQPALAYAVWHDGGPPGGYVLATCSVVLGLGAAVCLTVLEGIREHDVHPDPDVQ